MAIIIIITTDAALKSPGCWIEVASGGLPFYLGGDKNQQEDTSVLQKVNQFEWY